MSTTYQANPIAVQSPDVAPRAGQGALLSLQTDTDGDTSANWYQALKRLADGLNYQGSGKPWIWREPLFPTGTFNTVTRPIPNFGQLGVGMTGSGESAVFQDPYALAGYNGRSVLLSSIAVNNTYASIVSTSKCVGFANPNNLVVCAEIPIALVSTIGEGNVYLGFTDSANFLGTVNNYLYVYYNGTNWILASSGGLSQTLSATYNPVANNWQFFKFEFFGSSTPQGTANGSAYCKVSINDVLALTQNITGAQIPAANCYFGGAFKCINSFTMSGYVGGWTLQLDTH